MPRSDISKIETIPLPEIHVPIPQELLAEFKERPRVVFRHPWIVGIPIPWKMLINEDLAKKIKDAGLEVMVVPREGLRG